jgi:hypothetical protein
MNSIFVEDPVLRIIALKYQKDPSTRTKVVAQQP